MSTDAVDASVVEGAVGVAMVVATGVASSRTVGVELSTVAVGAAGSLEEIGSSDELSQRRCAGACCRDCCVDAGDQPSSVAAAPVLSEVSSAGAFEGGTTSPWRTSGNDGIGGGNAPIESSYTGSSGSGFGFAGAGRVVYAFVTTGT
jgi:hypothetical protein